MVFGVTVTTCGRICLNRRKINLGQVFAGETSGIRQVGDRLRLASLMHYDLGHFDDETCGRSPIATLRSQGALAKATLAICFRLAFTWWSVFSRFCAGDIERERTRYR